jgi:hypothetical protein
LHPFPVGMRRREVGGEKDAKKFAFRFGKQRRGS